ncbi:vanadium-dependent haloperoxidase [Flavitalea sp. BT771]|uniref:vanadium-dependent haloperoxidase n=1 Tax=Flavitalea sp. BT771 TaxID=3063329 RepID=UPI0026E48C05|nr:vanadium-dependent haloperoxidase [Flavitalea sp. BT771]MDO6431921.1 vanadium-dependent haloperoxidase [Flavitalea sp. BT771]MDV6220830.1 vanadium-dependent haloperoxidase [Flavitalea sp. BT771]
MRIVAIAVLLLVLALPGQCGDWKTRVEDPTLIHECVKKVTDVIVYDIFSPPVASRIYAYMTVAGYEAARPGNTSYASLAGNLHGLGNVPAPEAGRPCNYSLAAVQAILSVGKALVISEGKVEAFETQLMAGVRSSGIPGEVYANSVEYGRKVAAYILAWAAKDHYKETRSEPKYDLSNDASAWKPTPPAYMKAVEPHWSEMRTFLLDSARQFVPHPPTPFSAEKGSAFYQDALEVYDAGLKLTEEQKAVANFWDCNPFKMNVNGHLMFATKKISPGGHWINITSVACQKAGADFIRSAEAYAWVSIVIADAFISCWDEKYRSKAIRPETYINQYISADWMPLLQTPPFPEYTSGHSVVSACAAVVLTKLFGEGFAFTDSTEVEFGIPPRRFVSFRQAAEEAAISRFYGGIHFKPAINYGLEEGDRIGKFVSCKLRAASCKLQAASCKR